VKLRVKVVREGIIAPERYYFGDAGLDLPAGIDTEIKPMERAKIPTGLCVELPAGYVGLVVPRSGPAVKDGITHLDGPGIIDSGYRGEVHMLLFNTDTEQPFVVRVGDRLGQMIVVPFAALETEVVDELSHSERGTRGLGSSGLVQLHQDVGSDE
jgi:dUTP pyrophosphatase